MKKKVVRPSGPVKRLERQEFIDMLAKTCRPTVYVRKRGLFGRLHRYLMEWEGTSYYTETGKAFVFTAFVEAVEVRTIKI